MKTIVDVSAFLKRTGAVLTLSYDDKTGKFLAHTKGDEHASKYLDDALENLQEAARRRANGIGQVREQTASNRPMPNITVSVKPSAPTLAQLQSSISQAFASALGSASSTAPPPQYPTCPKCGKIPDGGWGAISGGWRMGCACGYDWDQPLASGQRVRFGSAEYKFDGLNLNPLGSVTP